MPLPSFTDQVDNADTANAADVNEAYTAIENNATGTALASYSQTRTLSGNLTLTDADLPLQYIDPAGNRDVNLPAEASTNHPFTIVNTADADETMTVKDDGGSTIDTVAQDEAKLFVSDGSTWKALSGGSGGREVLTANRTYYVRTDGSDSNTGLVDSAGGAFLTIQKAIDTAVALDLGIYQVTIKVGNGTFTAANTLKSYIGVGPIKIEGDETTPSNVVINPTSANCFTGSGVRGLWRLTGMKLTTTTSGSAISVEKGTIVETYDVEFGACPGKYHMQATENAIIKTLDNTQITGGAYAHYGVQTGGVIVDANHTITSTGTFSFTRFAFVDMTGVLYASGNTYTGGTITGTRYEVRLNGVIQTFGGGASYFPGDAAGSSATGGQYA